MNKSKTWRIGEECVGGTIQAKVSEGTYFPQGTTAKILVKDYKTAEVVDLRVFGRLHENNLLVYLHDITSSYYAEKVMEWVKENAFTHSVLVAMEGSRS